MKNFEFRVQLISIILLLLFVFTQITNCSPQNMKENLIQTEKSNPPKVITKVEVWAIEWDIIFSSALRCDEIKTWNGAFNKILTDKKNLSKVESLKNKLEMEALSLGVCDLDVRVRFDLFYSDNSVVVLCFETPYILSIDGFCYWDTDNITSAFSEMLPKSLGNEFKKDRSGLVFDYANNEIRPKELN